MILTGSLVKVLPRRVGFINIFEIGPPDGAVKVFVGVLVVIVAGLMLLENGKYYKHLIQIIANMNNLWMIDYQSKCAILTLKINMLVISKFLKFNYNIALTHVIK